MAVSANDFFGEPIYSYTCEQAVEDGVLIHPHPKTYPWLLISINVHQACQPTETDKRTYQQKLMPLLMDCILMTRSKANLAKLHRGDKLRLEGTVADTVIIGLNEKGGMTICQPSED